MDTTSAGGNASIPNPVPFGPSADTVREIPPLLAANPSPAPQLDPLEDDDDVLEISADPENPENSSILDALGRGPDSVVRRENFGSMSGHDLLSHLRPKNVPSGLLPSTDQLNVRPRLPNDDESFLSGELGEDDDSSAVDLGSRPVVVMPFALDVDGASGSAVVGETDPVPESQLSGSDSAAVDLLGDNSEFNLHRHPGASSALADLPAASGSALSFPTRPQGSANGKLAWLGAGAIGAAAATVLFAVTYLTVLAPAAASKPIVTAPSVALNSRLDAEVEASAKKYADLVSKLSAAGINPDQLAEVATVRDQAKEAAAKLVAATADLEALRAVQAKQQGSLLALQQERDQLASIAKLIKDAGLDAANLPAELKLSSESRRAAEQSAQEALARATALEKQVQQALAAVRDAEARISAVKSDEQTIRKSLTQFQQRLNQRLSDANLVAAGANADELLAGVDKALSRPTDPAVYSDPSQSDRYFAAGIRAYRDRDYRQAEQALITAVQLQGRDARIRYLLGVVRSHLGQTDDAAADFHAALALEQQYAPSPREVDEFLTRFQGADRSLVNQRRP